MFQQWINNLQSVDNPDTKPDQRSLERLTALLLIEIARADSEIDTAELALIAQAVKASSPAINATEIEQIVASARQNADGTVSFHEHIRQINNGFNRQQKLLLIEQMWRVAYADGDLDKYEEYTIRKLAALLYVEHKEFIKAKLKVTGNS